MRALGGRRRQGQLMHQTSQRLLQRKPPRRAVGPAPVVNPGLRAQASRAKRHRDGQVHQAKETTP
eukprot:9372116-Alexandrium_andersonii.AAC.1